MEPGLRPTDGVWAKHWYREVETSTGFRPYAARTGTLPDAMQGLYEECLQAYEELYRYRMQ